ncbi:MAG: ABC transporter permease [Candidatus Acidiferrales bacterium]
MGVPISLGRDITDADTAATPKVVVINQIFAERYLPDRNPLGHHVAFEGKAGTDQFTIVGVAAISKYTDVHETDKPIAYFAYAQIPGLRTMNYELRTTGDPAALLPEVRAAVREVAPDLPLLQPALNCSSSRKISPKNA